jgi:uncharacterized protein (UPF0332 family)
VSPPLKDLIRFRIRRAQETLVAAETLVETGALHDATSRIYYACFYVVSALLLTQGKKSAKHSGIRDLFNVEFVRTGRISMEHARFYRRIFDRRLEGDYQDFVEFERAEVDEWLVNAKAFVAEVSRLTLERMEDS